MVRKTEKVGKFRNVQCRTWNMARKLKIMENEKYELEVIFRDGYGDPGVRRKYVGRKDFSVVDQSPWR